MENNSQLLTSAQNNKGRSAKRPFSPTSSSPHLWLLAILAIGLVLRFANLGQITHSYDDSYPSYDALRMLDGDKLATIGQPSSIFLDNPALMTYIQAIPLSVSRSPWSLYIFIVALNTLAILLVYKATKPLLGNRVALLATFLFAVNPWVIYFSRTTWVQSLLPLFMALIAWGFWPTFITNRRSSRQILLGGVMLIAMLQTYIQAWLVLPQIGVLGLVFYRRLPKRPLIIISFLFILSLLVYGVGLSGSWEANKEKLITFSSSSETELQLTYEALNHALRMVTGQDFEYAYGRGETAIYQTRHTLSQAISYGLSLALWLGVMRSFIGLWRGGQERRLGFVLLIWFFVPILLMSLTSSSIHIHYLLISCPAGHVLAAWGVMTLVNGVQHWLVKQTSPSLIHFTKLKPAYLFVPFATFLTLVFGLNLHYAAQEAANQPVQARFDGWTLAAGAAVGNNIHDLVSNSEANFPRRIYAEGHAAPLSSLSGLHLNTGLELDFPAYVVLPGNDPLLYVLLNETLAPHTLGPKQRSHPERELIFTDGTHVSFTSVEPYSRQEALTLMDTIVDWPSEAGLSLLGYTLNPSKEAIQLTTYWRVDDILPASSEWYVGAFYHLVNDAGQTMVNKGEHSQWAYHWQMGDVYIEQMNIPLSADMEAGNYELRWGLFDSIHLRNFAFQSPNGSVQVYAHPLQVE